MHCGCIQQPFFCVFVKRSWRNGSSTQLDGRLFFKKFLRCRMITHECSKPGNPYGSPGFVWTQCNSTFVSRGIVERLCKVLLHAP